MAPIALESGGPLDPRYAPAPSLASNNSSGINTTSADRERERERLEMLGAQLQMDWAKAMDNPQEYEKISVLLIYWAENIDELKCKAEVRFTIVLSRLFALMF